MITESSREAFESIQQDIDTCRRKVYQVIHNAQKPICDREISHKLGWSINRVTPRRNELEKQGKIERLDRSHSPYSKVRVHHYVVTENKK